MHFFTDAFELEYKIPNLLNANMQNVSIYGNFDDFSIECLKEIKNMEIRSNPMESL